MKAVVRDRYGSADVLQVKDVTKPVPQANEVLVRIRAGSVNAADWRLLEGKPFLARFDEGLRTPKHTILGADIAGTVEAVGPGVTAFRAGDRVMGDLAEAGFGGFAEYAAAPVSRLVTIPEGVSFEEAAALPMAGVTALQALRDVAKVQPGQKVMIHGAGGGVGMFMVQLAKVLGAEVTAVCGTRNLEQACTLGADHVIDYTRDDFAKRPERYDVILGANGNRSLRGLPAGAGAGRRLRHGGRRQPPAFRSASTREADLALQQQAGALLLGGCVSG